MTQGQLMVALLEELVQSWTDLYSISGVRNDIRKLQILEEVRDYFLENKVKPTQTIISFYYGVYLSHDFLAGEKTDGS